MMIKIFILFLLTLIYSENVNLTVVQIKDLEQKDIVEQERGLICYELHKDIKVNDVVYFHISCFEDDETIDKLSFYNLNNVSCNNWTEYSIDFDNLTKEFTNNLGEPYASATNPKFSYEYKITKKSDEEKFILLLFKGFTGDKFSIRFDLDSGIGVLITILIIFCVLIFIVIIALVIICLYRKNKKLNATGTEQNSNGEEPLAPEENITQ